MSKLPKTVLPIYWISEEVALNSTFTDMFKSGLILITKLTTFTKWLFLLVGLIGILISFYMLHAQDVPKPNVVLEMNQPRSQETSAIRNGGEVTLGSRLNVRNTALPN
jgi:hypothetical protein